MSWLTWRQFRTQALILLSGLAVLAIALVVLGLRMRHDYAVDVLHCAPANCSATHLLFSNRYEGLVTIASYLLLALPGLLGVFCGAPLIAREMEEHTDRVAWNQSVTRTRWLAVKLTLLTLAVVAITGLFSLLLTWNASRFDAYAGQRFAAVSFAARNVAPLGYAAFAFVLGTVAGLLLRRTLPAMALTLAVFVVVQLLVPTAIRAHYQPPLTKTVQISMNVLQDAGGIEMNKGRVQIVGYQLPGDWTLSSASILYKPDGTRYTPEDDKVCRQSANSFEQAVACMARQKLHFTARYQPASRYWTFQWIELGAFLVLAALLAGVAFWRIRPRLT